MAGTAAGGRRQLGEEFGLGRGGESGGSFRPRRPDEGVATVERQQGKRAVGGKTLVRRVARGGLDGNHADHCILCVALLTRVGRRALGVHHAARGHFMRRKEVGDALAQHARQARIVCDIAERRHAGIRRIDALTGKAAVEYVAERDRVLTDAADTLKVQPVELPARIGALMEERRKLERELADARRALALGGSSAGSASNGAGTKDVNGIKFATRLLDGVPARELKSLADDLKKQIGSGVIAIVATHEGKAANLVAVTDDLAKRFDARELVKAGVAALGGQGGGGRPDMAQGGGPAVDQAAAALDALDRIVVGCDAPGRRRMPEGDVPRCCYPTTKGEGGAQECCHDACS